MDWEIKGYYRKEPLEVKEREKEVSKETQILSETECYTFLLSIFNSQLKSFLFKFSFGSPICEIKPRLYAAYPNPYCIVKLFKLHKCF